MSIELANRIKANERRIEALERDRTLDSTALVSALRRLDELERLLSAAARGNAGKELKRVGAG